MIAVKFRYKDSFLKENLKKVISILSDGEFHSGEDIGNALGITRSAVWKLIKQLDTWDLMLESVSNKGYQIPGGLTLLEHEKILSFLSAAEKDQLQAVEILDSIPSTNDYMLELARIKPNKNRACFAEKQTKGRGRQGRPWVSPFAKNIYLSLLWHFPKDSSSLYGLSLAVAVCIIKVLQDYGVTQTLGIKWPNDIWCANHKLGGVLLELTGEAHDVSNVVIGVGLNVNMPGAYNDITQAWVDVQRLLDFPIDRNKIAGMLLKELVRTVSLFQEKGFKAFISDWQSFDLTTGKSVSVTIGPQVIQGIGRGIDEQGLFLLETTSGVTKSFASGEVSVRLID